MVHLVDFEPGEVRPLSRREFEQLGRLGAFDEERVELIHGMVVRMPPVDPSHDGPIDRLTELFVQRLTPRARVRVQSAFAASDSSEPLPDLAVVPRREYDDEHPAEAYLVVEVARTSLKRDRAKADLYAAAGVPECWIVNVVDRVVEVHTDVISGAYGRVTPYRPGESITLTQFPDVVVAVDDVLR